MTTNKKNRRKTIHTENSVTQYDEMALVSTGVLADWVTGQSRCLWETIAFGPIPWTGDDDEDRHIAADICAGCPVRAECLELEVRTEREIVDRAWDAVHPEDRAVLRDIWSARFRPDVQATLTEQDGDQR